VANLYGVASPNPVPAFGGSIGGVNVSCPAGVETNVIAISMPPAVSAGWYYPFCSMFLNISLGATPPTALFVSFRLGAGSDLTGLQVPGGWLVANANFLFSVWVSQAGVVVQNPYAAQIMNVTLNPAAQAVTLQTSGSGAIGGWLRAPDQ